MCLGDGVVGREERSVWTSGENSGRSCRDGEGPSRMGQGQRRARADLAGWRAFQALASTQVQVPGHTGAGSHPQVWLGHVCQV